MAADRRIIVEGVARSRREGERACFGTAALDAQINAIADARRDVFGTNGLSSTEIAIKLISLQKSDGRWLDGTNDVSAAAVRILRSL